MAILQLDSNRHPIRVASPDKIVGVWKEVTDLIIEACKKNLGIKLISVYVGGSVPLGTAEINKSDVDAYAIVDIDKDELEDEYKRWADPERKRLDAQFPFQRGVEIHLISLNNIREGKKFQMKYTSACVYGKDLAEDYPPYRVDKESLASIRINVTGDVETAHKELTETTDPEEVSKIGTWIAKRLLRSSGVLVLWKENEYTMDIEPIFKMFIKHYPAKEKGATVLFEYATNGAPRDKQAILDLLQMHGEWLIEEDKRVFSF